MKRGLSIIVVGELLPEDPRSKKYLKSAAEDLLDTSLKSQTRTV